jgi:hypothetical protein
LKVAGFSEPEWAAAKQRLLEQFEARRNAMAAAPNVELARELSNALTDGRDLIPPDEMLRYAQNRLPTLGAQEGSDWWRRQWASGVEHIRVETPEMSSVEEPGAAIRATVDEAVQDGSCKVRPS